MGERRAPALLRALDRLEEGLIVTCMALATLVIFAAVLQRYSASVPWIWAVTEEFDLTWAQELCIYLFIWMAKFGAAYGVRTGIHVGIDLVVKNVPPAWRRGLVLFGLSAGAFFTAVVASLGGWFAFEVMRTGQVSPDLEMPMWIVYLAIPLGSGLMCLRFLQAAWGFHRTGALPGHGVGHGVGHGAGHGADPGAAQDGAEAAAASPGTLR